MEEDMELQLLKLLKENWQVDKENTLFHRNMRRVEGALTQPNVIVCDVTDIDNWNKEGMAECLALLVVRTRISVGATTNEAVEEIKQQKHKFREEVYRILKAVDDGDIEKPEGWEWAFPTRRQNEDNFDAPTPMLGEAINVTIAYERI